MWTRFSEHYGVKDLFSIALASAGELEDYITLLESTISLMPLKMPDSVLLNLLHV